MAEATNHYEQREVEMGEDVMREVERQVMLRIIDQRWREHLEEMDYLKEGINLRAMGQKDPLIEWQREGFEMFGGMMKGIAQDFVRYVMHVQVRNQEEQAAPKLGTPQVLNMQTSSSDDEPVIERVRSCCGPGRRRRRHRGTRGRTGLQPRPSRRRSPRTPSRRRHATHRARAARVRSSSSATAQAEPECVTSPTICVSSTAVSTRPPTI